MRSIESSRASAAAWRLAAALAALAWAGAPAAGAQQQQAKGFAVERLSLAPPGSGWLVMDDLNLQGGLGGGISLSLGYAHNPLRLSPPGGAPELDVVRHQTFASVGLAVTWDRLRLHTSFSSPLYVAGQSGIVGGSQFTAPSANLEQNPDLIPDVRLGLDARLLGDPGAPARLGASAELILPSGDRADYLTDDTYRGVGRLLFAGDVERFAYAGQLGVHLRPLDDAQVPGSPRGSELLFGAAAGMRLPFAEGTMMLGPEIFGATAFASPFGSATTALEGILGARWDAPGSAARRLRVKLGLGAGLHPQFGAPQWRAVVGVELAGELQRTGQAR